MINNFLKALKALTAVCVVMFFMVGSICYSILYIWDIIIGITLIIIRKLKNLIGEQRIDRWKNIKMYHCCYKIYSTLEHQVTKECLRYRTPLYIFIGIGMPITLIADDINIFKNEYIGYICLSFFFLFIYFFGMFVKNYNKPEIYLAFLNHNMEFLKLSFLPCTFIITIVGFLYTIQEEALFKQVVRMGIHIWENTYTVITSEEFVNRNQGNWLINTSIYLFVVLLLLYVVSLPVQILGYFLISIILYFQKYGDGYKKLLRQNIRWLKYVILGKSKKEDNKEVSDG